jgi:hypothetical protein
LESAGHRGHFDRRAERPFTYGFYGAGQGDNAAGTSGAVRALSHGEIVNLAGQSKVYQPVISPANLSDDEAEHSKIVNFKDYAFMAENWLAGL